MNRFQPNVLISSFCTLAILGSVACGTDKKSTTTTPVTPVTPVTTDTSCESPGPAPAAGAANPNTTLMFNKYSDNGNSLTAFLAVRDSIVSNAVGLDPNEVGPSFKALAAQGTGVENINTFNTNLANFLVYVYGGPNNYTGRSMATAHADLKITGAQYDVFINKAVVPALTGNGITDPNDLAAFAAPVTDPAFKASIVTCK